MKRLLLGGVFAAMGTAYAFAADLPAKAPVYKAAPAYSWSGLYGGISGGYAWGENKIVDNPGLVGSGTLKPSGGFGGLQIGYNNQFAPHWLIGGEIDFSAGDIQDTTQIGAESTKNKFDLFGTARTRFGYVQDRWLVYATGGAIWLQDKYRSPIPGVLTVTDASQYHVGWVFGGGIEYAVDNRWSWKLEYLYAPLDRSHDNRGAALLETDANFNLVRVGLNYRFADGGAPTSYMPVKAAAPRSNWNGSYIGLHGGYGWSKVDETYSPVGTASLKPDGWYGGFQGGYNWLFAPNSLLGIEVDSSLGNLKDNSVFSPVPIGATAKIEDLGTARLRLGYLMTPDMLVYATGGAAYAREKSTAAGVFDTKIDHLGWTAGAGVEYKFAPEWSLKAEYLYADLGTFKDNMPIVGSTRNSDITLNTVRIGLNYSGPVIERLFNAR